MSRDSLEKALYDLSTSRQNQDGFSTDPDRYLKRYQLNDAERESVKAYDVRALADLGVNTMLTWGFWLQSGRSNADYLVAMRNRQSREG